MLYLIEPSDANTLIAGEKATVFEYSDGSICFRYAHRVLSYQVFDKLACVNQGVIVDNKRLGAVLRLAQDAAGKRSRSKKMPRRSAQQRALEALKAINLVLVNLV